ncbi:MAG: DUF6502 family protein [Pseudomonadota bacterium]|nr:DUF6502 family protein [Pseudomonadota bacterium]
MGADGPGPVQPGEVHPALLRAVASVLRPLIRVFIAKGMTFPAFMRLAKRIYVEVAESDFPAAGKAQTDSRLHLLTGVHRKDIRSLRALRRDPAAPPPVLSRNAHMIALWTGAPDYRDDKGNPAPLPRLRPKGEGASFEGLVESVSKDVRARAVLDEWLRLGLVRLDEEGFVHLAGSAFVPQEDFGELAYYFGRNLRDHISASGHNLLGETPSMLERAVYYEKLTAESAEELAALARTLGSEVLVRVNRKAYEMSQRDKGQADATQRMSFGVYFFAGADDGSDGGEGK